MTCISAGSAQLVLRHGLASLHPRRNAPAQNLFALRSQRVCSAAAAPTTRAARSSSAIAGQNEKGGQRMAALPCYPIFAGYSPAPDALPVAIHLHGNNGPSDRSPLVNPFRTCTTIYSSVNSSSQTFSSRAIVARSFLPPLAQLLFTALPPQRRRKSWTGDT